MGGDGVGVSLSGPRGTDDGSESGDGVDDDDSRDKKTTSLSK